MSINNLIVSNELKLAVIEIQKQLLTEFKVAELVVFGPGLQGDPDNGIDLDLLAITEQTITAPVKQTMNNIINELNLIYHTRIKLMVFDKTTWEAWSGQALYQEIQRDGVRIW